MNPNREDFYNATVINKQQITPELIILRVKPDSYIKSFQAGQFASLGLLSTEDCVTECVTKEKSTPIKRPYSISHELWNMNKNLPAKFDEIDSLEFYISLVRNTPKLPALTPRLFGLKKGDRLFLGEPKGHYKLQQREIEINKHFVLCSTGTGEAPHNSFVSYLLNMNYKGRITVISCSPYLTDFAYKEKYRRVSLKFKNLNYIPLVTREEGHNKTYIQDFLESGELEKEIGTISKEHHSFYLCGNPKMIGIPKVRNGLIEYPPGRPGMIELLRNKGLEINNRENPEGSIHFERYW